MEKNYILDTNVIIEDEKSIEVLRNGVENNIYIPFTVIEELDKLKDKKPQLKNRIFRAIEELNNHKEYIKILKTEKPVNWKNNDNNILAEINENIKKLNIETPILVTNDKLLKFKANQYGIQTEEYKRNIPFKHESEAYTGFIKEGEELVNNCFYWKEGKINFYSNKESKLITYENSPWKVKPWNFYQNCFFDLILNDNIDLVTVQSDPGKGKSFLALAGAFYLTFQKKQYEKIYIVKSNYEIGKEMGWLPGNINDKMLPYFKPIQNLISKITKTRNLPSKCFDDANEFGLNPDYIEFLPINFLRGMNLENCVVIGEEIQNLSRSDARSFLSRMGENVKCICTGDINQIDNPYLDKNNNAMNWIVKLFKDNENYGHIVLKGKNTRGPICQMVIDNEL